MNARLIAVAVLLSALLALSCGPARRGHPFRPPPRLDAQQQRGERIFMMQCNQCHPEGDSGVGPALNNKPLPAAAIRLQVREGLGTMPAFGKNQIGDPELDALAEYLLALRAAKP